MTKTKSPVEYLVIGTFIIPLLITAAHFAGYIARPFFISTIIGWMIIFIGFVFEIWLIKRGLGGSDKSFIRNVLGAISIRLFATLILVLICLVFLELNRNNFIFSILIFYFIYLIIEVFYLNFRKY